MEHMQDLVYGERVQDLLPALFAFRDAMALGGDGMYHSAVTLEPEQGAPLERALLRAEAELMQKDADAIRPHGEPKRSYEQRAADAFVRLVQAAGRVASRGSEA